MRFRSFAGVFVLSQVLFSTLSVAAETRANDDQIEQKIDDLLKQMTVPEKIGQMSQLSYSASTSQKAMEELKAGRLGSILNPGTIETVNAFQKIAMEQSRLKIPLLYGLDVIHGYRTMFPIPLAQACSWNPELVEKAARMAAIEASSVGVRWTFAPMLDITHDPRWGRVAETCGEDPYLTSQLGAAMVRGFQGKDLSDPQSLAACAKHYVGYGATEGGRDYNTTQIPEPELRNLFLPSFKAAKDAGIVTFMSAFNDLNGMPSTGNPFILKKILREEWGFKGFVVSDWESVAELVPHGVAADDSEAARIAIRAGLDMEMVSTTYRDHAEQLLKDGKITMAMLDGAVRNILRVKYKLGLFEHPYSEAASGDTMLQPAALKVARELASQSIVLLKNEGNVLPLNANNKTIAVIGPLADSSVDMHGTWFCAAQDGDAKTAYAAMKESAPAGTKVLYATGLENSTSSKTDGIAAAVDAASKSDVVVLCLGEGHNLSGEARSRAFIDLPGAQQPLFDAVAATGKPIVLVIFAGRPLTFEKAAQGAKAVFYAFHPGTMAGPALCDLLFGTVAPSGKLSQTFPRTVGQIPIYYNHKHLGRPQVGEDFGLPTGTPQAPVGYFSKYLDVASSPAYSFGYGLSYTTYNYTNLTVAGPNSDNAFTITATVTNTGTRDGIEVVQLYTTQLVGSITRPIKELKGFQRVPLKAGESKPVTFVLPKQALGFYNAEGRFVVEPGKFNFWIGGNSDAPLKFEYEIKP